MHFKSHGADRMGQQSKLIDIRHVKVELDENLPTNHPLRAVIAIEKDYLTKEEFEKAPEELNRVLIPGGSIGLTLRSTEDSEYDIGRQGGMQISNAYESKRMLFNYFSESDIVEKLNIFKNINYGHKTRTLFEDKKRKIAHWYIAATK